MATNKKIEFFDSALGKAIKAGAYAFVSSLAVFIVGQLKDQTGIVVDDTLLVSALVGVANALIYGGVKVADETTPNLPN